MAKNIVNLSLDNTSYTTRPYGTCETAGNVAAKVVTCSDFSLTTGATILVKFTNSNSADSPTLNVNSTGAKEIKSYGSAASTTSSLFDWGLNGIAEFYYDGSSWNLLTTANTAHEHYDGIGIYKEELLGGNGTTTGRIQYNTKLKTGSTSQGTIGLSKVYGVGVDSSGYLCVSVPWTNVNSSYITNSNLESTLSDYVKSGTLESTLSDYVKSVTLDNYITSSNLESTLSDYVKSGTLESTLSDYVKSGTLESTLSDYVKSEDLSSITNRISALEFSVVSGSATIATIFPEKLYNCGEVSSITVNAASGSGEYMIQFTAIGSSFSLDWKPETLKWINGEELQSVTSGTTYQISIINNCAVWGKFS